MTCKAGVRCLWCVMRQRPLRIDELEEIVAARDATIEALAQELQASTTDQVEAMRTLSAFRRQYHDGTGALTLEVSKLRKEVARLKTSIKGKEV